jgi:hypothetical protein
VPKDKIHLAQADTADIAFANGAFTIAGTDRSMPIEQVAQMSFIPVGLPSELGVGLQGAGAFSPDVPTFPNGCHICELEIDAETGAVEIDPYTVVDDIGTVINSLLAKGQIQGARISAPGPSSGHCRPRHRARLSRGRVSDGKHAKPAPRRRRGLRQAGPTTASGTSLAHRIVSRSGRISDMPMTPPTSMMTPQIMKPVLKPSSGVAAVSTTLPIT